MRLATISRGDGTQAVVLRDEQAVTVRDEHGAEYRDVGALLAAGEAGLGDARRAEQNGADAMPWAGCTVLRPVLDGAVFCVGLNYRGHIAETGRQAPVAPIWFDKLPRALTDPGADIAVSRAFAGNLDYEGELAVVIGRAGRHVAAADAWSHVAGVTLLNDISARDLQTERLQIFYAKNAQASTPFGPVVATLDDAGRFEELELTLAVNGEPRQHGAASDLLFDVPTLIADLSALVELRPGDVIATGTPSGIGMGFDPPRWLKDGDVVTVTCPAIGTLTNAIKVEA